MMADAYTKTSDLWAAVDRLIDAAPTTADLLEHRLSLLAGRRFRVLGRPVPPAIEYAERRATLVDLAVEPLLAQIRSVYGGRMILLKGPELAARYPSRVLRPFEDIDLLVADAHSAHAALRESGFQVTGDPRLFVDIHHLRPLLWPTLPLAIEIHHTPKWIDGQAAPAAAELFADAVPARIGGIESLRPAHHAVLLAVHSWAHEPLRTLLDLVDIAVIAAETSPEEIRAIARSWGVARIWQTTERSINAIFYEGRTPFALRTWARNVVGPRGRTVLEAHLENWLSPFSALPLRAALLASARNIAIELRPAYGELWKSKLARTRLALRNGLTRRAVHHEVLKDKGLPMSPHDLRPPYEPSETPADDLERP